MSDIAEKAEHKVHNPIILSCLAVFASIFFTASVSASQGGISLSQTRVIFDAGRKSEKVSVSNQTGRVYLINSRVTSTPEVKTAEPHSLPFIITPPIFRLESGSRNSVLVVPNDTSALPHDRESLFYLSFLAIPAVSKPADNSTDDLMQPRVSVGIRSVIKLFYRPSGLAFSAAAAQKKLHFTLKNGLLYAENPTPYYLTIARLELDGKPVNVREKDPMIPPYSTHHYPIKGSIGEVSWSVIDDYGGISPLYSAVLH